MLKSNDKILEHLVSDSEVAPQGPCIFRAAWSRAGAWCVTRTVAAPGDLELPGANIHLLPLHFILHILLNFHEPHPPYMSKTQQNNPEEFWE